MPKRKQTENTNKEANEIKRSDLIDVLAKVKPGVANKEIIEQSNYFIFEKDKVWTYNDQISISQTFKSGLEGAVKAEEFYKLLDKINDEELKITKGEGEFIILGKTIEAKIKIDPDIKLQHIQLPSLDSENWQTLPEDFNDAVSLCLFSASKNMTMPELTCLYITGKSVFSTDSFRATKRNLKSKVKEDFLLPSVAGKDLIKYDVDRVFAGDKGWLHFSNKEKTMFSCRTFAEVEYPSRILDFFDIKGEKIDLPDSFEQIVGRVETLITEEFDLDRFIKIIIEKNILICKGKGAHGSISEKTKVNYKGKKIEIKVNPGFLIAILKQLDSVTIGERLLFQGDNFEHIICLSS